MLEGDIRDIDLVARLVEMWREQFTGALRFENDGIIKIIYFKGGDVLSASTNDRADSVDEILMRAGKVSREHVKQALAKRKENETLGDTLLNLGFITRKELTWARRVQVVGVIRSVSEWSAGTFTIVADYLPKRDEGTIFSLPQIVVEMVVTDQDRQKFERALESGSVVFSKAPDFPAMFAKLGLNEEADAIVSEVDGERTAAEVAAASGQETFNAYKLLHGLSLLGLLNRAGGIAAPQPVQQAAPDLAGFEGVGVADAADAWSAPEPVIATPPPAPAEPALGFDYEDEPGQETTPLRTPAPPVLPNEGSKMPAWDLAPRGAAPAVAPAPEPAADLAEEKQWGFDEAQIEAAQRATVPPVGAAAARPTRDYSSTTTRRAAQYKTVPKKRSYFGLIVTLMAIFIIAGVAYAGFMWWNARNAQPQAVAVARPHRPATKPLPPAATVTPQTASVAPPPAPVETATSPAPAVRPTAPPDTVKSPVAVTNKPAPTQVTARPAPSGSADRYAAMAREFAAAPSGKFTVQFEIVCEPSNITKALSVGGTNVWFVPITLKGRSCYRVFWGRYATREQAERGMRDIPASLREAPPAVVSVPQP